MHIDNLLSLAVQNGASDLHMKVGSYPMIRVDGTLVVASEERRLEQDDLRGMARTLMSPELQQEFETSQEVDCAYACRVSGGSAATSSASAARSAWSSA